MTRSLALRVAAAGDALRELPKLQRSPAWIPRSQRRRLLLPIIPAKELRRTPVQLCKGGVRNPG
jgi:hypothetical protein